LVLKVKKNYEHLFLSGTKKLDCDAQKPGGFVRIKPLLPLAFERRYQLFIDLQLFFGIRPGFPPT